MSDTSEFTPDTRVCTRCGLAKPISQFDSRFINKPVKIKCEDCRAAVLRESQVRWEASPEGQRWREIEERGHRWHLLEEEHRRQEVEYAERAPDWRQSLVASGYSDADITVIERVHIAIEESDRVWDELKRRYLVLDPPFKTWPRIKPTHMTRQIVYQRQDGQCFYCDCKLLSLDEWAKILRMGPNERAMRSSWMDGRIPELDHKTPLTRGGTNSLGNLVYACRRCNQRKSVRTADEFSQMPNDAISLIHSNVEAIRLGIQLESQGYDGFMAERPVEFRFPRALQWEPGFADRLNPW